MRDPERGREELRASGEKIRLKPDPSGRFLWADYSLALLALLPEQRNAGNHGSGGVITDPATILRLSLAA
jgi:hypothetical protein